MGEKLKAEKKKGGEKEKKVGENNGQLRFVRHHRWRTQAHLDQKLHHSWTEYCLVGRKTRIRT